ncbi:hypothetical protein DEI97_013770 [Curtobacterium sp. MCLR17_032]|uniref:hypothetical protein n=1 Tax=Curtobacterium sp. MCLR17_032 TaxID=2175650 RepID=UPI000DA90B19|nr:hypothetical protein [Curtobacterium sp. MCLR17_032]WIE60806.1 hypothetical protein DEI97_013770 [Curtobacterium sp. MCLR17_032]
MKLIAGGVIAVGAPALAVGGLTGSAFAEGSFTSSLNQVQPTFSSRQWIDNGSDNATTTVTLSSCEVNAAGKTPGSTKLSSVKVTLYRNGRADGSATHACGTYSFGNPGSGTYQFVITAINGNTSGSNRNTFLNASKVAVNY